jgi:hypothetical protein
MIEITTSLPDEIQFSWSSNGHASWLEDEDGIQYRPPEWVYRLVAQARLDGRNEIRRKITEILKPEQCPADPQKLCNSL